jgi:hypothetical protein
VMDYQPVSFEEKKYEKGEEKKKNSEGKRR